MPVHGLAHVGQSCGLQRHVCLGVHDAIRHRLIDQSAETCEALACWHVACCGMWIVSDQLVAHLHAALCPYNSVQNSNCFASGLLQIMMQLLWGQFATLARLGWQRAVGAEHCKHLKPK